MSDSVEVTVAGDNYGIVAGGDVQHANLIRTGDVQGALVAIGAGAQIIIQQVQTPSPLEEHEQARQLGQAQLAAAITAKVSDYTSQLEKGQDGVRRNPYKDLPAYQLADAPFFFGRDAAIAALLGRIHQAPLTVLHAASGAGKSSLLQAGLMSRLLAAGHLPLYIRTRARQAGRGESPLGLAEVIKAALLPDIAHDPALATLRSQSLPGFLTDLRRRLKRSTLYLFLDQFEDFFNDALMPPALRAPFIEEMNICCEEPGLDVRWILALRKEFYSDLYVFGDAVFTNQFYLAGLSAPEAERVIVEPARQAQVDYAPGLVAQILHDLAPHDGIDGTLTTAAAPVAVEFYVPTQIQLVCHRLFAELAPGATVIDWALYHTRRGQQKLPGVEGILTGHLQTVLTTQLPAAQRGLAALLLEELVSSQTQRLPHSAAELIAQLRLRQQSLNEEIVHQVLDALVNNRLLERDELDGVVYYELVHDYLIAEITAWIGEEERERKRVRELLLQEVSKAQGFGTTLNPRLMDLVDKHRAALNLNAPAGALLLQSALQHDYQVEHWLRLVSDENSRFDAVKSVLAYGTEPVRLRAVAVLGAAAHLQAADLLRRTALEDASREVREQAAKSLARRDGPSCLAPFAELATARQGIATQRAVEALAHILDANDYGAHLAWPLRLRVNGRLLRLRFSKHRRRVLAEIGGAMVGGMVGGLLALWLIQFAKAGAAIASIFGGIVFGMPLGFLLGGFIAGGLALRVLFRAQIGALWGACGAAVGGYVAARLWQDFTVQAGATGAPPASVLLFAVTFGGLWGIGLFLAQRSRPDRSEEDRQALTGAAGIIAALASAVFVEGLVALHLIPHGFDGAPLIRVISFFALGAALALGLTHPARLPRRRPRTAPPRDAQATRRDGD